MTSGIHCSFTTEYDSDPEFTYRCWQIAKLRSLLSFKVGGIISLVVDVILG